MQSKYVLEKIKTHATCMQILCETKSKYIKHNLKIGSNTKKKSTYIQKTFKKHEKCIQSSLKIDSKYQYIQNTFKVHSEYNSYAHHFLTMYGKWSSLKP
jgi:hypothetical protein